MAKWKNGLIGPDATVQDALAKIDAAAMKIALVVDTDLRLIGTLSDGDIRRALLAGTRLSDPIAPLIRTTPTTARFDESRESILYKMRRLVVHQIPVLDEAGRVVDVRMIDDYLNRSVRENWVVIMAGGLGTRLKELTRETPKPMLSIGDKPLLETIVGRFVEQGFHRIWISVFYHSGQIEKHFGDGSRFGADIQYLHETKRLGTAGALCLLPQAPTAPLLVTNADLLTSADYGAMLNEHVQSGAVATMAVRDFEYQIPYGVVHADENRISALDEKPVHHALVNAGIYVLSPEAVARVPHDTFFDMPELFGQIVKDGQTARYYRINGYWLDIGRHEDFHKAIADFPEVFL